MVVNDMEQIIFGIIILLVIVGIIFFIVVRKQFNSDNENINVNISPLEDSKVSNYNQSDVNMLNSLNDNVITNKPKNSKIVIPDFDKSKSKYPPKIIGEFLPWGWSIRTPIIIIDGKAYFVKKQSAEGVTDNV